MVVIFSVKFVKFVTRGLPASGNIASFDSCTTEVKVRASFDRLTYSFAVAQTKAIAKYSTFLYKSSVKCFIHLLRFADS